MKALAFACMVLGLPALGLALAPAPQSPQPATVWLTVLGDPGMPSVNTIQVDPSPVEVKDEFRVMRVRVSRSIERSSWDRVPYRSYESTVLFDCAHSNARYLSLTFYMQPGWKGPSHMTSAYSRGTPRWMEFRDVQPNPTQRIIRAACQGISR